MKESESKCDVIERINSFTKYLEALKVITLRIICFKILNCCGSLIAITRLDN